jgi:hypothetical protein
MKTQEPFKWGFLRWQRMSQKQRTAVFFISTARFSPNDRTIRNRFILPHREAASGKDKMLFPISDVGYQPAFHASLSNDR